MKLPKTFFQGLSKERYQQYLRMLPEIKGDKTQAYTTLIFTFSAIVFFGLFAIAPTLATITELKKQLEDHQYVADQLTTKISNLSQLHDKYASIQNDLPVINAAVPDNPAATELIGKLQAVAKKTQLSVQSLQAFQVEYVSEQKTPANLTHEQSFVVTFVGQGSYAQIASFVETVSHLDRLLTIENLAVGRSADNPNVLLLNFRVRAYFRH